MNNVSRMKIDEQLNCPHCTQMESVYTTTGFLIGKPGCPKHPDDPDVTHFLNQGFTLARVRAMTNTSFDIEAAKSRRRRE